MATTIHPHLRLSSLDKLPIMKRRLAKSITASAGPLTQQTVSEFATVMKNRQSTTICNDFVPVFYFLLDTARIPQIPAFDSDSPDNDVAHFYLSLGSFHLARRKKIFPDLWPRLDVWCYYFFQHEELISSTIGLGAPQTKQFYLEMMHFLRYISSASPSNHALIISDRKSHILAGRAYRCFSDEADFFGQQHALLMVRDILTMGKVRLGDVLEGFGGDISDLARLIMRHCELGVPWTAPSTDKPDLATFVIGLNILVRLDESGDDKKDAPRPMCAALIPLGFVKIIIKAGLVLGKIPSPIPEHSVLMCTCLTSLQHLLETDTGNGVLQTAVHFGLLNFLLAASSKKHSSLVVDICVGCLLVDVLTSFTVYYHVLEEMQKASALDIVSLAERMPLSSKLARAWRTFGSALRARLELRDSFNADPSIQSRNICGNCGVILPKLNFKRCSECRWITYCSTECQALDWDARHRVSCAEENIYRLKIRTTYTRKEYSFLRFLIHHSYTTSKSAIALAHVLRWEEDPDAWVCTILDYASFPVRMETIGGPQDMGRHMVHTGKRDTEAEADGKGMGMGREEGMFGVVEKSTKVMVRMPMAEAGRTVPWLFLVARESGLVRELREIAARRRVGRGGCGEEEKGEGELREEVERVIEGEGVTTVIKTVVL
ncbi:hypothetical protein R3P38DRAFT_3290496 [Favolaschia claudopus]|uniref:MYND-type domain-containing protein n=1 Tax=Favolaschia claudopus TaxID=2862362 RepID=A0AAV9ZS48_9AGAR